MPDHAAIEVTADEIYLEWRWDGLRGSRVGYRAGQAVEFEVNFDRDDGFALPVDGCDDAAGDFYEVGSYDAAYPFPSASYRDIYNHCTTNSFNYAARLIANCGGIFVRPYALMTTANAVVAEIAYQAENEDDGFAVGTLNAEEFRRGVTYYMRYRIDTSASGAHISYAHVHHAVVSDTGFLALLGFTQCPELAGDGLADLGISDDNRDDWLNSLCVPTGMVSFEPGVDWDENVGGWGCYDTDEDGYYADDAPELNGTAFDCDDADDGNTQECACSSTVDCDDADVCTGIETCVDVSGLRGDVGVCQGTLPLSCGTEEICDAAAGCLPEPDVPNPTITVSFPTTGDVLVQDVSSTVDWLTADFTGRVKVEIYDAGGPDAGGTMIAQLGADEVDDGVIEFTPTADLFPAGTDYVACVTATDETVYGCGGSFTIEPPPVEPYIDVLFPSTGDVLVQDVASTVDWLTTDFAGRVKVEIYDGGGPDAGGAMIAQLGADEPDDGQIEFTPTEALFPAGTDYVACVAATDESVYGCGDSFTIEAVPESFDLEVFGVTSNDYGVVAGDAINVTASIRNNGTATANAEFDVVVSGDSTYSSGDTVLCRASTVSVAAGASSYPTAGCTIPSTLATGTYYLFAVVDRDGDIAETDESNNSSFASTRLTVSAPTTYDLEVFGVSSNDYGVVAGDAINVTASIRNNGTATANAEFDVVVSTNSSYGSSDTVLCRASTVSVSAGASSYPTAGCTIPSTLATGTYYLFAVVDRDGDIAETDESNNNAYASTRLTVSAPTTYDLALSYVDAGDQDVSRGESTYYYVRVTNNGTTTASVELDLYYSSNTSISSSDTFVCRSSPGSIAAGASTSVTVNCNVPSSITGSYYLGMLVDRDGDYSETNESNNSGYDATLVTIR